MSRNPIIRNLNTYYKSTDVQPMVVVSRSIFGEYTKYKMYSNITMRNNNNLVK